MIYENINNLILDLRISKVKIENLFNSNFL